MPASQLSDVEPPERRLSDGARAAGDANARHASERGTLDRAAGTERATMAAASADGATRATRTPELGGTLRYQDDTYSCRLHEWAE